MDRAALKNTLLSMVKAGEFVAWITPTKVDDAAVAWAKEVFSNDYIYDMIDKLMALLKFMQPDDVVHILNQQLFVAQAKAAAEAPVA